MVIAETIFTGADSFPWRQEGSREKQKAMYVSRKEERGISPVWEYDDFVNGKKEDHKASYHPDYTGTFITDWEIHSDSFELDKQNNSGLDYIVDWKN